MHSLREAGLLFLAAVAGGIINSVAGGGGFICFPALLFTGVPPISANATNTIALWPGTAASVVAYRKELRQQDRRTIVPLAISSIIGGLAGALLLLLTPQQTFLRMVPWLMLVATLLFVFGGKITELIRKRTGPPGHSGANADPDLLDGTVDLQSAPRAHDDRRPRTPLAIAFIQLAVSVYIGYFGAGAGIVILALLAVMGMQNIHSMNGIKTLLACSANGIALITFIVAHTIYWPQAILMLCGAILGGYGGAWYAQRLRPAVVRGFVIATGCLMTTYFFWRT
ncbi:MAG TPA: sulfite exporter TauE/SafE family protein [Terriglobales bacterium]|nr:sulfite exporter TauE/SafE family protein [Terriglobales bacterium]